METNQFLWKETEVDGAIPIVNFSINTKELSKNDIKDSKSLEEYKKMPIITNFKKD